MPVHFMMQFAVIVNHFVMQFVVIVDHFGKVRIRRASRTQRKTHFYILNKANFLSFYLNFFAST